MKQAKLLILLLLFMAFGKSGYSQLVRFYQSEDGRTALMSITGNVMTVASDGRVGCYNFSTWDENGAYYSNSALGVVFTDYATEKIVISSQNSKTVYKFIRVENVGNSGYNAPIYSPPQSTPQARKLCYACYGRRTCVVCRGSRVFGMYGQPATKCGGCGGTGKCDNCNGTGYQP